MLKRKFGRFEYIEGKAINVGGKKQIWTNKTKANLFATFLTSIINGRRRGNKDRWAIIYNQSKINFEKVRI